jgi:hypothetical protein
MRRSAFGFLSGVDVLFVFIAWVQRAGGGQPCRNRRRVGAQCRTLKPRVAVSRLGALRHDTVDNALAAASIWPGANANTSDLLDSSLRTEIRRADKEDDVTHKSKCVGQH